MFKALDTSTGGSPIVSIDPQWAEPIPLARLRDRCREDRIQCPWCRAPVVIRAGKVKTRHFAHKSLEECPYAHEEPEKLLGRQALYEWLTTKADPADVELEVMPDGIDLPMPLDVSMRFNGRQFGYWFLHRNIRNREQRDELAEGIREGADGNLHLHPVFSSKLLKMIEDPPGLVRLSTTHRALRAASDYARLAGGPHSLHFLDTVNEVMTTLRGLQPFEPPQTFRIAELRVSGLDQVKIRPSNGEIVHEGEHEALGVAQVAWKAEEERRVARARAAAVWRQRERPATGAAARPERGGDESAPRPATAPTEQIDDAEDPIWHRNRTAICERCGKMTAEDDWIVYDGATHTCKCRDCMR